MNKFHKAWYVLYVKSQHEMKIDNALREMNISSFLPTITTVRIWSDRKKKIKKPLFPSYIFVEANTTKEFYCALKIPGAFKYIRFNESYAKVKHEEIIKIKQLLTLDGIAEIKTISNVPSVGDIMKINYGSLTGLECKVIKANNTNRIFVRIESIRQNITAKIPSQYLSPL